MVGNPWPTIPAEIGKVAKPDSTGLGYTVGLIALFLLSGVFVAAKFGIDEMPPWTMCFWRLIIAFLVLLPLVWGRRHEMAVFFRQHGLAALVVGALGLGVTQGLIYTALAFTSAINTSIIFSITPIITLIMAGVILHEPMGKWQYVGSAIAFVGILVTAVQGSLKVLLGLQFGLGDVLVLIVAFFFALYTVLLRRENFSLGRLPLLVFFLAGAAIATFPGWMIELALNQHSHLAAKGYIALAYVAIPGGALMYLLFNWSINILGASRAGALLYSQMVFTAILAWLILGEAIRWYHLVGAALIIVGVVFIELLKAKPAGT